MKWMYLVEVDVNYAYPYIRIDRRRTLGSSQENKVQRHCLHGATRITFHNDERIGKEYALNDEWLTYEKHKAQVEYYQKNKLTYLMEYGESVEKYPPYYGLFSGREQEMYVEDVVEKVMNVQQAVFKEIKYAHQEVWDSLFEDYAKCQI